MTKKIGTPPRQKATCGQRGVRGPGLTQLLLWPRLAVLAVLALAALAALGGRVALASGDPLSAPENISGVALHTGMVSLDWDDVTGAESYEVEYWNGHNWLRLPSPADGITASFDGSEVILDGLHDERRVEVQIRAVNASGVSEWSAIYSMTSTGAVGFRGVPRPRVAGTPDAPTDVVASTTLESRIDIAWVAPTDTGDSEIIGYRVEYTWHPGDNWSLLAQTDGETTISHEGVRSGASFGYRVSAINDHGRGPSSLTGVASTFVSVDQQRNVPGPPESLAATATQTSITLSWQAPTENGGADVTGYQVEWSSDGVDWTELAANTPELSYQHSNLSVGTEYRYRVAALNSAGAGAWAELTQPTDPAVAPDAPESLSATATQTSVTLSWRAPSGNGGADVTGYQVEWSSDSVDWSELAANTTELSYEHSSLSVGTEYRYRVAALNSAGAGAWTELTQSTDPAVAPDAPEGLSATATQTSITLSWEGPTENGGAEVAGYQVEWSSDGVDWIELEANTPELSYEHASLKVGTAYHYRVAALNSAGAGAWAELTRSTDTEAVAGTVAVWSSTLTVGVHGSGDETTHGYSIFQGGMGTLSEDTFNDGDQSIQIVAMLLSNGFLAFNLSPEPSDDFVLTVDGTEFASADASVVKSTRITSFVWPTTRVWAENDTVELHTAGPGVRAEPTQSTDPAVAPGAPEGLSATATQTAITLSWRAPSGNGGADVTGYQVEWSSDGVDWSELAANTPELSYQHSSLSVGTEYRYRVAALNSAGAGAWAELTQSTDPAVAPDAPEGLSATATQTSITLLWEGPTENGGAEVAGYQVEWSSDGVDWTELAANTPELSYEHSSLKVGTVYHYRVAAINTAGVGERSQLTQSTDPAVAPDAPEGFSATATQTSITLSWQAPTGNGGADVTGYQVEWSSDGVDWSELEANTPELPYEHSSLTVGTEYRYRVAALNSAGIGAWAELTQSTDPAVAPDAPEGLSATATQTAITLSWQGPTGNGGADVTGYKIEWSADGVDWIELEANTPELSYEHSSLTVGTEYRYRVAAINTAGPSVWAELTQSTDAEAVAGTVAVWSSTLTVGVHGTGSETTHGYSIFQGGIGTLSEDTFNDGDQSIQIVAMLLSNGFLAFNLKPEPSDDFVLTIDGADYASADASLVKSTRITSFVWPTTQVWAEDDMVELHISAPAAAATPNSEATGAPEIHGTVQVSRTLTADTSGIADADGLSSVDFTYQWLADAADISGATGSAYQLTESDEGKVITLGVSFSDDGDHAESLASEATAAVVDVDTCPADGYNPVVVDVEAEDVPIVVASTTGEYFVLYVRPDLTADREIPVSLTLGQDGATTLTEQLAALPHEHYRVEKFLVADPTDIDGDCIDDITELGDPVGMNPLNRAKRIRFHDGAVAIPDRETFEALSYKGIGVPYHGYLRNLEFVKFYIVEYWSGRPIVYFMNTNTHRLHPEFWKAIGGKGSGHQLSLIPGELVLHPNAVAPDGSLGVYRFEFNYWNYHDFEFVSLAYELLAASMPLLEDNLAYHPLTDRLIDLYEHEQALYDASRVNVLLAEEIRPDVPFLPMNLGEGYGFLREMTPEERPNPRDIVIYETLPNQLSRVAGIMTTVPQTPLSHVNLRAVQDGVPNAFIRDALDDDAIEELIGRYVHYSVTESGYTIRAATPAEVEAHDAASRPAAPQVPERDLSVTGITALDEIGFDDWNAFGVKAANLAVLRTLGFPEGTVPDGFAVPFYFYDEFMKHNGFYDEIEELLADPDFQSDYDTQESGLKALRKKIKKGESPQWMIDALTTMHDTYPEGQSLRYRSSTNNEDLPGFSGAGLYDSKTQHAQETVDGGIDKSLKQVFAGLWNFRAFVERESRNIDQLATAMGVLVHPNFSDELANGVAVSFDPFYDTDDAYYVNTQLGEDLVTNPDAFSVPEELLLHQDSSYNVLARSNLVARDQLLMSDAQMEQLRGHLETIHDEFAALYEAEADRPFAMEIEFKITSDDILSIKQARPWVFPDANRPATGAPAIDGRPQAGQTLTADISAIDDFDGLSNASFRYQWVSTSGSIDTDIEGATDASYEVSDDDVGKTIKVRVAFTDNAGYEETLTSSATVAVAARPNRRATGAPAIDGTPQAGHTLTADTSAIADADGLDEAAFAYQWLSNDGNHYADIEDATDATYELADDEVGQTFKVRVTFTDGAGFEESMTSAATEAVIARGNTYATGAPTIDGRARAGQTLTADVSEIDDVDGFNPADVAYQWLSNDGSGDTGIADATDSSYALSDDDVDRTIKVRVTFTDGRNYDESLTSAATAAVVAADEDPAVWSANMEVVEITTVSIGAVSADQFSNQGGSPGFQVRQLWYSITERKLRLSFVDAVAVADDFTLQVGDLTLEFPAGSSESSNVSWDDVDVDWEIGKTLLVRISDGATPPATDASSSSGTAQTRSLTDTAPQESTSKDSWKTDAGTETELGLTAEFRALPASHDGTSTFTFELYFSAEVKAGFARIRDHAFEVTDGNIEKAQRLTRGSNLGWRITVQPDSNADVVLKLPETTDCDAAGAVCTADRQPLSAAVEHTVGGPGS